VYLTHESSSLCSFQRSRCDHFIIEAIALSGTFVPSKLNSAVP
jgi:hypothetical protein